MSARTEKLFEIKYVTDHDCGNYHIGEIDFGIYGTLREYLKQYGRKGKDDIVQKLAFLIYETEREFRSIDDIELFAAATNAAIKESR